MQTEQLTIEQRTALLEREIQSYVKRGFRVLSRTDTTAQLVKPKEFGCLWIILACVTLGLALILYLVKKDQTVYLDITPTGKIKRTKS